MYKTGEFGLKDCHFREESISEFSKALQSQAKILKFVSFSFRFWYNINGLQSPGIIKTEEYQLYMVSDDTEKYETIVLCKQFVALEY